MSETRPCKAFPSAETANLQERPSSYHQLSQALSRGWGGQRGLGARGGGPVRLPLGCTALSPAPFRTEPLLWAGHCARRAGTETDQPLPAALHGAPVWGGSVPDKTGFTFQTLTAERGPLGSYLVGPFPAPALGSAALPPPRDPMKGRSGPRP